MYKKLIKEYLDHNKLKYMVLLDEDTLNELHTFEVVKVEKDKNNHIYMTLRSERHRFLRLLQLNYNLTHIKDVSSGVYNPLLSALPGYYFELSDENETNNNTHTQLEAVSHFIEDVFSKVATKKYGIKYLD